jgi:hypothetical protein
VAEHHERRGIDLREREAHAAGRTERRDLTRLGIGYRERAHVDYWDAEFDSNQSTLRRAIRAPRFAVRGYS